MSKFGGIDYILAIQDKKHGGGMHADQPAVNFESKQTITDSAMDYAGDKSIPTSRCFSTRQNETTNGDWFRGFPSLNPNRSKFSPLSPQSFLYVTENDKLFIFAHGSRNGVAYMAGIDENDPMSASKNNAVALAKFLRAHGLRSVGLITFKSCWVGATDFLREFSQALAGQGIRAGWLKGYKGTAATTPKDGGGFTEVITAKDGTVLENPGLGGNALNNARLRIVRGPGGLFAGQSFGRFDGATV